MLTPVPPTACQRAREAVSIQLDGELSELGSARLSAHLRECEACASYALELAALTTRLRMAPLEQPGIDVALPPRRRRPALQIAAAAAAVVAAAATSLAVGHAVSSRGNPAATTSARTVDLNGLHADIVDQHVLAMLRHLPPAREFRLGRIVML
jgi:predicted anti-sigma-YlaC factor YlaD